MLAQRGTLALSDLVSVGHYTFANGSSMALPEVHLKRISVGGIGTNDVVCGVTTEGTDGLLGMAFLGKFDSFSIDNARNTLVLNWTAAR